MCMYVYLNEASRKHLTVMQTHLLRATLKAKAPAKNVDHLHCLSIS